MPAKLATKIVISCVLLCWQLVAQAQKPVIAIIIDDLGNKSSDEQVINLPGAIACAFLPHTPHVKRLAKNHQMLVTLFLTGFVLNYLDVSNSVVSNLRL